MDFKELAKDRYSCRKFSNEPVEQEKLDKIIASAIAAPTACNIQPFKIWVIKSDEALKKIADVTPFTFDSKLILVVGAKTDEAFVREFDGKNFAEIDATIVATHIMLAVHDLGLGTTWVGYFKPENLKSAFSEMSGYEIVGIFPIGYPALDAVPSPMHEQSKSKEKLVSVL